MKTSPDGIMLLHHYEGCELTAYPDPATGGDPWTIGYGNTGPGITRGMTITQAEADVMFSERLASEFEPGVSAALAPQATQGQFDACVSLAYNIGVAAFRASTLVRKFNAGDIAGAADQFLRWDKAAGKSMRGLRRRRAAERALFQGIPRDQAIKIGQAAK